MISKPNNNSPFRSVDGMDSEQELTKNAQVKSEKARLITETAFPSVDSVNSRQEDFYSDQWSPENTLKGNSSLIDVLISQAKTNKRADKSTTNIEPTSLEIPNLVSEKKKP